MTQSPPPQQQVPPGYPDYTPAPKPPVWPLVVGILSTIFGSLGLLCACASIPMNIMNPAAQQALQQFPEWWRTYQIISGLFGFLMAVVLLSGGICLIRRRPAGLPLSVAYGVLGLIGSVLNTIITVSGMAGFQMPGPMGGSMKSVMMVSPFVGLIFGAGYPIFLLIWFARPSIRQEVRSWPQPAGGQEM
jgi:hypothetical protein